MHQAARIVIKGKVQGIFFRAEAQNLAQKLHITGWIRNNPDGSVEALAQGNPDPLAQFLEWCKQGPSGARIENVHIQFIENSEEFSTFQIVDE